MWPKKQWSNLVKMVWPYTLFKKFHLQKYTTTPYPPFTLPFICARSMPQSTVEKSLHKWGLVVFVILSLVISFNSLCSKYTVGARGRKMNCVSVQLKVHATPYTLQNSKFMVEIRFQLSAFSGTNSNVSFQSSLMSWFGFFAKFHKVFRAKLNIWCTLLKKRCKTWRK